MAGNNNSTLFPAFVNGDSKSARTCCIVVNECAVLPSGTTLTLFPDRVPVKPSQATRLSVIEEENEPTEAND